MSESIWPIKVSKPGTWLILVWTYVDFAFSLHLWDLYLFTSFKRCSWCCFFEHILYTDSDELCHLLSLDILCTAPHMYCSGTFMNLWFWSHCRLPIQMDPSRVSRQLPRRCGIHQEQGGWQVQKNGMRWASQSCSPSPMHMDAGRLTRRTISSSPTSPSAIRNACQTRLQSSWQPCCRSGGYILRLLECVVDNFFSHKIWISHCQSRWRKAWTLD